MTTEKEYLLYEVTDEDPLELRAHSRVYVKLDTEFTERLDTGMLIAALRDHPVAVRPGKYRLFPAGSEIDLELDLAWTVV